MPYHNPPTHTSQPTQGAIQAHVGAMGISQPVAVPSFIPSSKTGRAEKVAVVQRAITILPESARQEHNVNWTAQEAL